MPLRRIRGFILMLMAFSALIVPTADIAMARPLALQAEEAGAGDSGVTGNSYVSPTFGYSITWDRAWEVSDELNEDDYNKLVLTNEISTVYIEGIVDPSSLEECLAALVASLEETEGVSDVAPAEATDGTLEGQEEGRSWAVYNFVYTGEDGESIDLAEYMDCRPIVDGESLLVLSSISTADDFESQIEPLGELFAGLALDGSTGPNDETDEDSNVGEPGDENTPDTDLAQFVMVSAADIDAFWTREFPLISGGQEYTPPTAVIPFDDEVQTDCGAAKVGEIGPFYCPPDSTVYYDLTFGEMQVENFGSTSVVAVAMAHEVAHHIQNLMQWKECEQTPCLDPTEMTSQEFELQADCFAGAWVADAETRGRLGSFDVETNIAQFAFLLGDEGIGNTADPGTHGKGARRVYMFLDGYYKGVTSCLAISAATDPARNGGANANTNTPTDEPTATPDDEPTQTPDDEPTPTDEPTNELIQMGDEFEIGLRNATLTMTINQTETIDEIDAGGGFTADGTYVIVFFSLVRNADAPGPFTYDSFILTDSAGNEYEFDEGATDALLKTSEDFADGVDQEIDSDVTYNLAIVFDVPTDASDFIFSTSGGDFQVELDV